MAGYRFAIKSTEATEDLGGMDLADDAAAVDFGIEVIRDLMQRWANQYTGWTMEIKEGDRAVGSVAFTANALRN
jgi:hypothetical protein